MRQRRLEAEAIRDAMMTASGDLDLSVPTGSLVLSVSPRDAVRAQRIGGEFNEDSRHRSVYLPIYRDFMPPALEVFDVADPEMVTGQRDVTTVAPQALYMMNNAAVIAQAHKFANRVQSEAPTTDAARIDKIYNLTLSRSPSAAERQRAIAFVHAAASELGKTETAPKKMEDALAEFCQAMFASAEFRYLN
jgi:hypothetical protein